MDIANSAGPDQTPKNAAYDEDFHSLHTGTCISIRNKLKMNAPVTLKIANRLVQFSKIHQAQKGLFQKLAIIYASDQCPLSLNMKAVPVSLTIPSCSS